VRCGDVGCERSSDIRQRFQELDCDFLGSHFKVGDAFLAAMFVQNVRAVAKRAGNLLGQTVVQCVDKIAHVVDDVVHVEILAAPISGEENLFERLGNFDHGDSAGQRAVSEVIDRPDVLVGSDDAVGELRNSSTQRKVSSHVSEPCWFGDRSGCPDTSGGRNWCGEWADDCSATSKEPI
jgi:hypothetical protein